MSRCGDYRRGRKNSFAPNYTLIYAELLSRFSLFSRPIRTLCPFRFFVYRKPPQFEYHVTCIVTEAKHWDWDLPRWLNGRACKKSTGFTDSPDVQRFALACYVDKVSERQLPIVGIEYRLQTMKAVRHVFPFIQRRTPVLRLYGIKSD